LAIFQGFLVPVQTIFGNPENHEQNLNKPTQGTFQQKTSFLGTLIPAKN
jgi:hypothetical protein